MQNKDQVSYPLLQRAQHRAQPCALHTQQKRFCWLKLFDVMLPFGLLRDHSLRWQVQTLLTVL